MNDTFERCIPRKENFRQEKNCVDVTVIIFINQFLNAFVAAGVFLNCFGIISVLLNHFPNKCSLLTPLKTSENQRFFDVFRGIKREYWEEKG